jgi:hypothetical protein
MLQRTYSDGVINFPRPPDGYDWVCIDLDGTLAERVWPEVFIGDPLPQAHSLIEYYQEAGHKVMIYTARSWQDYRLIEGWFEEWGLPKPDAIVCGKPVAALYIDDRGWCPPWA